MEDYNNDNKNLSFVENSQIVKDNTVTEDEATNITNDTNKKKKLALHVELGNRLMESLNLKSFNSNLYFYDGSGVYIKITEREITSIIIRYIYPAAEPTLCKKTYFYVDNMLYNEDIKFPDTNFVNFKNLLYDLNTNTTLEHSSKIFTLNQLNVDYIENLPFNEEVEIYLDDVSNHKLQTRKAILEIIGYFMTCKNNIQKVIVIYGPSAANGKSVLLKIIEKIIGSKNICHKSIEEFDKDFGADGMEYKQLNISTELPLNRIKDISTFKKTVTGDTFETKVKFEKNKTINTYIKHLFATNFIPNVADTTEGYYRRLHIILLDNKFDPATSTFNIETFCTQENLNYLANLAFREYLKMIANGSLEFANVEESNQILENFRIENDTVLAFVTDPEQQSIIYDTEIERAIMFKVYKSFCNLNELKSLGKKAFYREMRDKYKFEEHIKKNGTQICFYREKPIKTKK